MSLLVDTNVLSELLRQAPSATVLAWFEAQRADELFVSSVTQAEMMLGARLLPAGKRRQALESALHWMFEQEFAGRVLAFDEGAAGSYVDAVVVRRKLGRPISQFDAQIAAIAASRGMTLVTRNVDDFEGVGIPLVDPSNRS